MHCRGMLGGFELGSNVHFCVLFHSFPTGSRRFPPFGIIRRVLQLSYARLLVRGGAGAPMFIFMLRFMLIFTFRFMLSDRKG